STDVIFHFQPYYLERLGIDGIGFRKHGDAAADRQQAADIEMFASLRLDPFIGGDDQQHHVDAAHARQHVAHKALVAGDIDEPEPNSIVMPRRFSSSRRSASMPVRAFTSAVFPWSICPAVPTMTDFICDSIDGAANNSYRRHSRFRHAKSWWRCDNEDSPMTTSAIAHIAITPEMIREHGLTPEEFEKIKQLLGGREPTRTELGIFSVMWSE